MCVHVVPMSRRGLIPLTGLQIWNSPVYSLMLGTTVTIVLSSDQAVKDLLDKRGGIYSSRPRVFEPDRYLGDDSTSFESATKSDVKQRDHFTFGAGRRLCQGMHIADRSLFLGISRLLWGFELKKTVGVGGHEVVPDQDNLTQGFIVQPTPFPAQIIPRSAQHAK